MTQTETLKTRILDLVKKLNRHGAAATGELKEAVHGLAENARKEGD